MTVFDFHSFGWGVAAHDISRILADSPAFLLDAEIQREYCLMWHGELLRGGVTGYSPEDAWFDYLLGLALAMQIGALCVVMPLDDPIMQETSTFIIQRCTAAAETVDLPSFVAAL